MYVMDMVGRSDFPTTTQYTKSHIRLMKALLKTKIAFRSEVPIPCWVCKWAHVPDILAGFKVAVFIDGSIHDKASIQKKDHAATEHLKRMEYRVFRYSNRVIDNNALEIARQIAEIVKKE